MFRPLLALLAASALTLPAAAQSSIQDALDRAAQPTETGQPALPAQPVPYGGQAAAPPAPPVAIPALRAGQAERLLAELEPRPAHGFAPPMFDAPARARAARRRRPARRAELVATDPALRPRPARRAASTRRPSPSCGPWCPRRSSRAPSWPRASRGDRLDAWLASLPPPYVGYRNLTVARERYREIVEAGGWLAAPRRRAAAAPRRQRRRACRRCARRLAAEGYGVGAGTGATYDAGWSTR